MTAVVEACPGDEISVKPDARGARSLAVTQVESGYKVAPFWVTARRPGLLHCVKLVGQLSCAPTYVWAYPTECVLSLTRLMVWNTLYCLPHWKLHSGLMQEWCFLVASLLCRQGQCTRPVWVGVVFCPPPSPLVTGCSPCACA